MSTCLNCGAALQGRFCGQCGQRAIPPYPSVREMAADAWHEFSGWDGRFVRTFRKLLHPGVLTVEVLEGRRARYVSPLRLYLVASLLYFLVAALVPSMQRPSFVYMPGDGQAIDVRTLSAERRAALVERVDQRAPWWAKTFIRSFFLDPRGLTERFREAFPRALFVLLPVYAAIVALFYRRRPFSQHLVFGLHLHAAAFVLLAVAHLANLTGNRRVAGGVVLVALAALAVYALRAFRRVYRASWPAVLAKSAGIAVVYAIALGVAVLGTFAWSALR